jgi:hypothetical protein
MASSTFNICIYTYVYSCIIYIYSNNTQCLVILQRSMSLLRQIPPSDITISANAVVYLIGGFNIRKWSLDFTTSWKMQAVALATDVLRVESEHLTTLFGSQPITTHHKSTWLKLIRVRPELQARGRNMALSQTNIASKQRAWKYCQIQAMQAKHISGYYTPYHAIILFELHITIIRDTLAEWYINYRMCSGCHPSKI